MKDETFFSSAFSGFTLHVVGFAPAATAIALGGVYAAFATSVLVFLMVACGNDENEDVLIIGANNAIIAMATGIVSVLVLLGFIPNIGFLL